MATQYINFGAFESRAAKIDNYNNQLLEKLTDIQKTINNLEPTYQSNASTAIREKINGMSSRFQSYYDVVDKYSKFVKSSGEAYRNAEAMLTQKADDEFI